MRPSVRNAELLINLKELDLKFEIQDAIDGQNLNKSEISKRVSIRGCNARLGYKISKSLIGCGLSHREVYKKAFKSSHPWILVLEEDAILKNFSVEQAAGYLINLPAIEIGLMVNSLNGAPDWPDWAQKVLQKGVYPWMIEESQEGSTIETLTMSKSRYILRRFSQLSGIHYLYYRREYSSFSAYIAEEVIPYLFFIYWRIKGSKFLLGDRNGPQIL
jgi:hypothetical protein